MEQNTTNAEHRIMLVTDGNWDHEVACSARHVLVEFSAEWSGSRYIMEPIFEDLASAYGDRLKIVRMNVDRNSHIQARYGVRFIPTILLFRHGELVGGFVGTRSRSLLERRLNALLDNIRPSVSQSELREGET